MISWALLLQHYVDDIIKIADEMAKKNNNTLILSFNFYT